MSVMTDSGAHARKEPKGRSRADVWFVLVITGGTSATLQMWHALHATHAGGLFWLVAALVGIVPAATAIGLSHVVVSHKGATWLRAVTVGVMLAVMAASGSAIAATVHPLEVKVFNWVLALALDAAALACVWVLLGDNERKAAEATALELAQKEAAHARTEVAEAAQNASGAAAELAAVRAALEADVTRLSAELAAANATAEALRTAAHGRRSKGRSAPRKPAAVSRDESSDEQDLTAELRAIQMLDAHPELRAKGQGSELGRRLGISPAHGRRLHAALTSDEHTPEHPAQATSERPAQPVAEQGAEHPEG